jgi:hypothetical protein
MVFPRVAKVFATVFSMPALRANTKSIAGMPLLECPGIRVRRSGTRVDPEASLKELSR